MGNEIILTTSGNEYEFLVAEIKRLKICVAALTVEKDDLEFNVCRKLHADYDRKIGHLEMEITRLNLEIERLRSVMGSMQAAVNRGEAVSRVKAEEKADEKFRFFFNDLEDQARQAMEDEAFARKRAEQDRENHECSEEQEEVDWEKFFDDLRKFTEFFEDFVRGFASEDDSDGYDERSDDGHDGGSARKNINPDKELRMLYLKIMKTLHPDNKKDRTPRDDELLLKAKEAFESGDLKTLREIAEMIDEDDIEGRFQNTPADIEELKILYQQLTEQKASLENSIARIKSSFPYNMKEFLKDKDAVAARQEELKEIIESCKNTISALNERIALLEKEMTYDNG